MSLVLAGVPDEEHVEESGDCHEYCETDRDNDDRNLHWKLPLDGLIRSRFLPKHCTSASITHLVTLADANVERCL
jgi:hypothetical protein